MSLINREDTINYLMTNMNWHDEDGYTVEDADEKRAIITDLINGVPDADDGWISCKDRLPEFTVHFTDVDVDENGETYSFTAYESDRVLVCGIREDEKGIYTASYNKWVFSDGREEETDWLDCFGIDDLIVRDVTAWMPLPKPYKPKEKTE